MCGAVGSDGGAKVSICMAVYHRTDLPPGNSSNANTTWSLVPAPSKDPRELC